MVRACSDPYAVGSRRLGADAHPAANGLDARRGCAGSAAAYSSAHRTPTDELPGSRLWRDWKFLTLAGGMAVGLFAQIGLTAHLFSLLAPTVGAQKAGSDDGTGNRIGNRRTDVRRMADACRRGSTIGRSASAMRCRQRARSFSSWRQARAFHCSCSGSRYSAWASATATSLPPLIAQREFANEDVARVVALIVAIAQAGYAFAPAAFGLIRTLQSDAAPAAPDLFLAAALLQALAIAAFLAGRQRTARSADGGQRNPGPPHDTNPRTEFDAENPALRFAPCAAACATCAEPCPPRSTRAWPHE